MSSDKPVVIREVSVREYLIGRELNEEECRRPLRVLRPGEIDDVILRRSNSGPGKVSNVPRRFYFSETLGWGYSGAGPYDLAFNILFHFSEGNEEFTRKYIHLFVKELVSKLPNGCDMLINGVFLKSWVLEKINSPIDDEEKLGGTPFQCGSLTPVQLVWSNNSETILAPAEIS